MSPTSPKTSPASRAAADRCPGALRLVEAADGYLARVRLPGGFVTGEQLRVLADLAAELGDGRVELTSRGNVQLRALAADAAEPLTAALTRAGLLPSLDHDRVRNVLASPLAGLDGLGSGRDLTAIVAALDAGLCARPRLAELSGRFLFAIDDGRGDVAGLGADVVAVVGADGAVVNGLAVNGSAPAASGPVPDTDADADDTVSSGLAVKPMADDPGAHHSNVDAASADVVAVMLAFAEAFLDERAAAGSVAWRIADLPDGAERVRAAVAQRFGLAAGPELTVPVAAARPVGLVRCPVGGGGGVEPRSVTLGWFGFCRAARSARAADRGAGDLAGGPRGGAARADHAVAERGAARPARRGPGAAGGGGPRVRGGRQLAVAARHRVRRAARLRQRAGRRAGGRGRRSPPAGRGGSCTSAGAGGTAAGRPRPRST